MVGLGYRGDNRGRGNAVAESKVYRIVGAWLPAWALVGLGWMVGCLCGMLLVIVFDEPAPARVVQVPVEVERKQTDEERAALERQQKLLIENANRLGRVMMLDAWEAPTGHGPHPDTKAWQTVREFMMDYGEGIMFEPEWECRGCGRWGPRTFGWVITGSVYGGTERFNGPFKAWVQYVPEADSWSMPRLWVKDSRGENGMVREGPLAPAIEKWATDEAEKMIQGELEKAELERE